MKFFVKFCLLKNDNGMLQLIYSGLIVTVVLLIRYELLFLILYVNFANITPG